MLFVMTQDEKDALLGKVVRETAEHEKELRALLVSIRQIGARLRNLADVIDTSGFGVVETQNGLAVTSMSGSLVVDSYKAELDYDRIAKLEKSIRDHSRELSRLQQQLRSLGI